MQMLRFLSSCLFLSSLLSITINSALANTSRPDNATVRVATFNASLNRGSAGQLITDLSNPDNPQAQAVAQIIQLVRPHVLLVNEFDYDSSGTAAQLFRDQYLAQPQGGAQAIYYPYYFVAASNTGIPSGLDLDNSGAVGGPGDAFGFGFFPGQFGMAVYSMYPIAFDQVRTFQQFLWRDMPGALLPDDPATSAEADWYSDAELAEFRLSSKSHWDVPIEINGATLHLLASHPTPPVFDDAEDRNGRRNHDEIRFWADYVQPGRRSAYIYDDLGQWGGLPPGARFVIAGDLNADPFDGDSTGGAAQQLLKHPRINISTTPAAAGAAEASARQGDINLAHRGDPVQDTADFAETNFGGPGNLRVDYVLPSKHLRIRDAGVFWPEISDPLYALVGDFPFPSSDHRLVWIDIVLTPARK